MLFALHHLAAAFAFDLAQPRIDDRGLDEVDAASALAPERLAGAKTVDGTGEVADGITAFGLGTYRAQGLVEPGPDLAERVPHRRVLRVSGHPGLQAIGLAAHDIRVNAIGPGTIATELARKAVMGSPQARTTLLSRTPMKRLGEPDEVARVAVFLASDDASYMTGQTVYPDGGRLALNYTVPVVDTDGQ